MAHSGRSHCRADLRAARLRGRFRPLFKAESLLEPRWCNASLWVDEGWCAFDNNFSLQVCRLWGSA